SNLELFIFSNSTVSGFYFNGSNWALSFKVNGRDGTFGYVNLILPKDFGEIKPKVFFDEKEINYLMEKTDLGCRIYFTYIHSTHNVIIYIYGQEQSTTSTPIPSIDGLYITITATLIAITIISLIVFSKVRRR
ncbi:MAG: hypothetical protein QXP32_08920, partial [Nitrososphaeria archaeon]